MQQPSGHEQNADQIAYWNGPSGQRWADRHAAQESLLGPIADVLIDRAKPRPGERVLDVGCGSGATTFAFAKAVAPNGFALGLDVSDPMLSQARAFAPKGLPLDFVLADATVHPFEPASFDLLASRFGVMFFADPVASFTNLRRALKPTGRLAFACWREPKENPWMMAPLMAVYKHVPKMPPVGPEEPGPFAFASEERVTRILEGAGFVDVAMEPHNLADGYRHRRRARCCGRRLAPDRPGQPRVAGPSAGDVCCGQSLDPRDAGAVPEGADVALQGAIWIVTAKAA